MNKSFITPAFLLLFIENLLFFTSQTSLNTLPAYLTSVGASKSFIGFFMNINPLMLVVSVVFFSRWMNKIPQKKQLLTGFVLQFIAMLLMFFFYQNLNLLLACRFIASIAFVAGFTVHTAVALALIPPDKRTGGLAVFGISGILANPIGSFIGELILKTGHPQYMFLVSAGIILLAAFCLFKLQTDSEEKSESATTFWDILRRKEMSVLMITAFSFGGAWSVLNTFIPGLSLDRFHGVYLSTFLFAFSLIAIVSRAFYSGFVDKMPEKRLLLFSLTCIFISLIGTMLINRPWQFLIVGVIYGAAHAIIYPVLSAVFVNSGRKSDKIILSNTFIACYTFGNVGITTILGFIGDSFGTLSIFICMAAIIALCIPLVFRTKIRKYKSRHSIDIERTTLQ